jgi:hypothetical protein
MLSGLADFLTMPKKTNIFRPISGKRRHRNIGFSALLIRQLPLNDALTSKSCPPILKFPKVIGYQIIFLKEIIIMENEKKSYMQQLADRIVEWDKKINELRQQGNTAASTMKEDYAKTYEELKKKRQETEEQLKKLMSVSAEGWDELRKGAELAFLDMSKAMEKALSKFKK